MRQFKADLVEKPKITCSHPTGNANVRSTIKGFAEADILHEYVTTLSTFEKNFLYRLGAIRYLKDIRRRSYDFSLKPYIRNYPFYEVGRILANKLGWDFLTVREKGFFCIEKVNQTLDKKVASSIRETTNDKLNGVYAYEDGALHSFKEAKKDGLSCFYDLPIGYWRSKRELLLSEVKRRPEWASTIPGLLDSDAKLTQKDEEINLADHIFVASSFTKKTLKEFRGTLPPVHVIPYGFPEVLSERSYTNLNNRQLKVLFVGSLTQRKGIADLFEAVNKMSDYVELTLVGKKIVKDCTVLNKNLLNHNWIPSLAHHKVLDLMETQDILLFPSLFEGFGLVITEAMSQGTPVITTDRTAGPDIISHGEDGWLIEAGSPEAIEEQLIKILRQPTYVESAGKAAIEKGKQRPWQVYADELSEAIINLL